jgi:outer membrane usher protein FimD/PapC
MVYIHRFSLALPTFYLVRVVIVRGYLCRHLTHGLLVYKYSFDSIELSSSSLLINNNSNLTSFNLYTNLNSSMTSPYVSGGISIKDELYQLKLRISSSLAFWCGAFQVRKRIKREF